MKATSQNSLSQDQQIETNSEPQTFSRALSGTVYRSHTPLVALAFRDNHHSAMTIPAHQILHVVGPAEDDRFVTVKVGGEDMMVFESDLLERGRLYPPKKARATQSVTASESCDEALT